VQPLEIRSLRNWTEAKRAAHQVNVTVAALSKMQFCEDVDFATQKRHLRPLQFSHRIHLMRPTQIYDIKKKRNKKRASQVAQALALLGALRGAFVCCVFFVAFGCCAIYLRRLARVLSTCPPPPIAKKLVGFWLAFSLFSGF